MVEALSNLSCCFDASKDVGEMSVELVICNCPVSKRCCLKWETFTYFSAVIFSIADVLADAFGYVGFVRILGERESIDNYVKGWLVCLIISGVLVLSEVALPVYSLVRLSGCCTGTARSDEELDEFRQVAKYWSRANNILVIITEDGIIALLRILIAFKSLEAVQDLQTTPGVTSSAIAFVITIMRHVALIIQIIIKLSRNGVTFNKCPPWDKGYCTAATRGWNSLLFLTLMLSSCSVALTGMSMAISAQLFEVHFEDNADFRLNITLLSLSAPAVWVISLFIIVQTRW